nr:lysyl oxidase family protein [Patulibacter sp. SYSU D01012]
MDAEQVIHRHDGGVLRVRTGARLEFKLAHLHRRWWKMHDAARFELWRLADDGTPRERVRVGPKVAYCLRDLERNHGTLPLSPRRAVYPACSTSARRTHVTLGTSVGWSDVYPPDYPEQWIDVTGLRGCFAYVHTADPTDAIRERDETNNQAQVVVRLPFRARDPRGGCAGRQFGVRYRGAGGVGVW